MNNIEITTSSTCDLTVDLLNKNNIKYIEFNYQYDNNMCKDNFYKDISPKEFFSDLDKHEVKTSQPSPEEYVKLWEDILQNGKDILHIELSSGISGAYNSSLIAKDMILEKYPNSKIEIIDSLCASAGLGLLVLEAIDKKNNYENIIDFYKYLNDFKLNINHIFISSDLSQFFKGGRLSKTGFIVGKLLNIVPIMSVDKDGKLYVFKKTRNVNNALKEIADIMSKIIIKGSDYDNRVLISNSDCIDLAEKMIELLKPLYLKSNILMENVYNIGFVIGSHTGKGTLAVFFVGNGRDIK